MKYYVTTAYRFTPLTTPAVTQLKERLEAFAQERELMGLCLVGPEGINLTVAGREEVRAEFQRELGSWLNVTDLVFKDSESERPPFRRFEVKVKNEIVTIGRPGLTPPSTQFSHLSPEEWHQALQSQDTIVIDTRNDYEVEIGKFKTAIDFGLKEFHEFPEAIASAQIPKDKKVLIYCTGGIRCEKAILAMHEQGFHDVHQLEGGILNYIKEYPNQEFEGECFVFDYRVAVDQELKPTTRYTLCTHCGQPADHDITCTMCGTKARICSHCLPQPELLTCSKNCAHHALHGHQSRKSHKQELTKRKLQPT